MTFGTSSFRVIDTGIRGGRANIAFDQALIEAHKAGKIPNTIRFLRFRPSALVGIHRILSHEVRRDYCQADGIEIGRRITGGGGLISMRARSDGSSCSTGRAWAAWTSPKRRVGSARALRSGSAKLGIPARYRPRNDIEVDGRRSAVQGASSMAIPCSIRVPS